MKKMILIILLLTAFSTKPTSAQPVKPRESYGNFTDFVKDVKKTIEFKRLHKIGSEENIVLEQGQSVHLDFEDNPAGIVEFIIFYDGTIVRLIYRHTDKDKYIGTSITPERKKAYRLMGVSKGLHYFYEYESKNNKAFIKFRTTVSLSEKDQQEIKEIDGARKRRKSGNTIEAVVAKLREKVGQKIAYEFGTATEVMVVPDQKAVLLKCSDNPEDVKEILIGANSKYLYIYCIRTSGSISGGGSTLGRSKGSFRQIGGSAAIGMWERKDEKINVQFQLADDDNTISQSYRELEERGHFSKKIKNWNVLLDDPELIFPRLTSSQRIEAFTRLWSTVKFNFANFDLVPDLNWDDILSEYLPKVMAEQSNGEYSLLLQECIARLRDGHTSVSTPGGNGLPTACPPLRIRSVSGKAIVTELAETEEVKASAIKLGDEITHVDGRAVQELLEKDIYPYISASTPQGRDLKAYPRILQGPKESTVSLSLKTLRGEMYKVSLTRKANGLSLLPRRTWPSNFEYRDIGDDLAYVALNTFGNSDVVVAFNEKFKTISNAKGLIIDVRKNGGGSSSNGWAIVSQLIDKAIPATRWKTPQYRAAFRAWGSDEPWYDGGSKMIEPKTTDPFLGPVVVLIGPETNSAAEDFVVPLHAAGRATIVGQKSRGSTGQPLQFSFLDGKIRGRVCTKRDTYPDDR
ncbi:MAG: S41 family peptidase, partial [Planctomycetota bacterium]